MKRIIQLLIIGLLGFSMMGCHGCKEPVMADPCEGVEEVVADFKVENEIWGYHYKSKRFEVDTFVSGYVFFTAVGQFDSVKWIIGDDPRIFKENEFSLIFSAVGNLDITMIGYRKSNTDCLPLDDGIDTLTKAIVIVPISQSRVFGHYNGHFLSQPDSAFQLFIDYDSSEIWSVNEFPKGYPRDIGEYGFLAGYRNFLADYDGYGGQLGPKPGGWGRVSDDTIIFDFHYFLPGPNGEEVKDTYVGVKF